MIMRSNPGAVTGYWGRTAGGGAAIGPEAWGVGAAGRRGGEGGGVSYEAAG